MFEFIPAIDVLGGRCVRLAQGRYEDATVYDDDPASVAARFAEHPITRLHVVDLDGAKAGAPRNGPTLRRIVEAVGRIPVQLGGGLRNLASVQEAFEAGVDRAVLGTVALRDPELVREAARRFPGRIVVGLDAHDGRVSVEGWTTASDTTVTEVAKRFEDAGVAALVHTDIARDGMLEGPNLEATAALASSVAIPVIVSGGVSGEADVVRASAYADRGVAGVIVGRALYTGAVEIGRVLEKLGCS